MSKVKALNHYFNKIGDKKSKYDKIFNIYYQSEIIEDFIKFKFINFYSEFMILLNLSKYKFTLIHITKN